MGNAHVSAVHPRCVCVTCVSSITFQGGSVLSLTLFCSTRAAPRKPAPEDVQSSIARLRPIDAAVNSSIFEFLPAPLQMHRLSLASTEDLRHTFTFAGIQRDCKTYYYVHIQNNLIKHVPVSYTHLTLPTIYSV